MGSVIQGNADATGLFMKELCRLLVPLLKSPLTASQACQMFVELGSTAFEDKQLGKLRRFFCTTFWNISSPHLHPRHVNCWESFIDCWVMRLCPRYFQNEWLLFLNHAARLSMPTSFSHQCCSNFFSLSNCLYTLPEASVWNLVVYTSILCSASLIIDSYGHLKFFKSLQFTSERIFMKLYI